MPKIQRALISVSDKSGLIAFCRVLHTFGVEILSTGGTAKLLRAEKIPVIEVSDYTGSPEILDGRLKTLHPKIHGGILGMRGNAEHVREMKENQIQPIDLIVVNLYPFEATIARPKCTLAEAIENIDIGGPTMIRAAAKNYQDVTVVVDAQDYQVVMDELSASKGSISAVTNFKLAQKVFATTARYEAAIANYLTTYEDREKRVELPRTYAAVFEQVQTLRYGENPHQRAAFYRDVNPSQEPSLVNAKQLHGKELSYNNIMDADAALNIVKEFPDASFAACIIKHANPCGAALSQVSLSDAFLKAKASDPVSAFGGIVAFNRTVDEATATAIGETFFEVIAAPRFAAGAVSILAAKKNLRLLEVPGLGEPCSLSGFTLRKVAGGLLLQDRDVSAENVRGAKVATKRAPTEEEWAGLEFAWRISRHVKSNAIVFASQDQLLGAGAGQTSRVDAVNLAVQKLHAFQGTQALNVMASDAFFPFRDGVDLAAKAGITAIVQPGGSLRDEEVIKAADEYGMAMVFTGFRHFYH
ncbi:MAG: bifunctional phosphoribosylaminoimidazolecarboxamide formyltransferase/IMP cyclohydrolase [Deltaproteobacteria bacterium]|nr:bifunctional phosphoribosylaminoimidazolecarboxamide formyltransferase/IMP cyclohydrolase [Deltaproteobacteria bacterium]